MSTFEQTLNAGVPVTFPGGEQFHLLEADEPVDVTFYDNRNRPIEIWEGMKGGFHHTIEEGFIQVRLESATGQTVKIALTSGRGQYDRSQGDVTVLNMVKDNSWYYDSLQKKAFIGGYEASSAGFASEVQLWNPAASGKLLICKKVSCRLAAASKITVRHHNAAISNTGTLGNKYLGEAAGAGLIKQYAGAAPGTLIFEMSLDPSVFTPILPHDSPMIIPEGIGLVIHCTTITIALVTIFEWIEIPA